MSFISGVEDPCISAWSPKSVLPNYLLTGSYEGVYSTGHERNVFDLYSLENDELNKVTFSYKYKYQIIGTMQNRFLRLETFFICLAYDESSLMT